MESVLWASVSHMDGIVRTDVENRMDCRFQGSRSMIAGSIGNLKRGSKAHEPELPIIPMMEALIEDCWEDCLRIPETFRNT